MPKCKEVLKGCRRALIKPRVFGMVASHDLCPGDMILRASPLSWVRKGIEEEEWMKHLIKQLKDDAQMKQVQDLWPRDCKTRSQWSQKLYFNTFESTTRRYGPVHILYSSPSWFNHSCMPNAEYSIHPVTLVMNIKAVTHIPEGQEIFISYGDDLGWFQDRDLDCMCTICHSS